MDVSVNMQRKFEQSMPIDIEVPQILFIARVLDIPVMPLRRARAVQTVQKMRIPQRSSWEAVDTPVVFQRQVPGLVQRVLKTVEGFRSCSTDKVVGFPVVQVIDKVGTSP